MKITSTLCASTRDEFRTWLAQHHQDTAEVWLVLFKQHTGKQTMRYEEAVEEAICFGWVDSRTRGIDEETYAIRFSPRRTPSNWSSSNRARALKMLQAGKITPTGLATLPADLTEASNESN